MMASGLMFVGFGLAFMARPAAWAATAGLGLQNTLAFSEIRTFYGGLEVGMGGFLVYATLHPLHLHTGLVAQVAIFAGLIVGRIVSLLLDGSPGLAGVGFAATELTFLILGATALVPLGPAQRG